MKVVLDLKKSINENASDYFDKAKKLRKKAQTVKEVIKKYEKKYESSKDEIIEKPKVYIRQDKKWYEKIRRK